MNEKVSEAELRQLLDEEAMRLPDLGVALSGMAGRFPKADSVAELEACLLGGVDMVNEADDSRFSCGLWGLPQRAGRLKDLSRFDNDFFGFAHEDANHTDFQLRILYEVAYEAILDAGANPAELRGSNTGVFLGLHCNEFENAMAEEPDAKPLGYFVQHAARVAQYFDFRGLTNTYDAACASGLVALNAAVEALQAGLVERALVASSNVPIKPMVNFAFLQLQMLSPTGYSRFLDSRADGYVKSEATVAMLLERKHLARRNYASFMATMSSVDGFKPEGITFPSLEGQERLIRAAKERARLSTNNVQYIEAHGTGTPAGDPQEAQAIANVYLAHNGHSLENTAEPLEYERKIGPLLIGSSKTNMGHSEGSSGLCALAKVALMLEHELIYRCLHYEKPNPLIRPLVEGRLKIVEQTSELLAKVVPLSCYGFGGSNVHAIVRANERPAIEPGEQLSLRREQPPRLVLMFGRTKQALDAFFDALLDERSRHTRNCLTDDFLALVDALSAGKIDRLMVQRGYLLVDRRACASKRELWREIAACELPPLAAKADSCHLEDLGRPAHAQECAARACNLVLPGLGAQWARSAAGLRRCAAFWSTVERLARHLAPFEDHVDLVRLLTEADELELAGSMAHLFVSVVAFEVALINVVRDQVRVNQLGRVVGHSLGEIACAYAVGLLDEREAIMVAYRLGKTLSDNKHLIRGKMLAVASSEPLVDELISGSSSLRVSCVNGPNSVTVSGSELEVDRLADELKRRDVFTTPVESCTIALHNETIMCEEIKRLLEDSLKCVLNPGADYKICDNKQLTWISSSQSSGAASAEFFAASLCKKVDFLGALEQLADDSIALELGPSAPFEAQLRQVETKAGKAKFHHVKLTRRQTPEEEQLAQLLRGLGALYLAGATFRELGAFHEKLWPGDRAPTTSTKRVLLPVRRQTPSLSSLWRWSHEKSFFVPRYPAQFSKSSAKSECPLDILQERDKHIADHRIEGRVLYPATGYLYLIWRVFSFTRQRLYDAVFHEVERALLPVEFHQVRLHRAVLLSAGRESELRVYFDEATGHFEISEANQLVAEGWACEPREKPRGLLYEQVRSSIRAERLEQTLTREEVYKQFRLSGYDYGPHFQNILSASGDGRHTRVNYNGRFATFTDGVLQAIFLAVTQYAPSGGLFLPTRFDYVRFQPQMILEKLAQAEIKFDATDESLGSKVKRGLMTQMMQRGRAHQHDDDLQEASQVNEGQVDEKQQVGVGEKQVNEGEDGETGKKVKECVFETFCDPISGVIITDGVEMRGIRATPAPRRVDNSEVLLESYQFVADLEEPVEDAHLAKLDTRRRRYAELCDSMAVHLAAKLSEQRHYTQLNGLEHDRANKYLAQVGQSELFEEKYLKAYLASIYNSTGGLNAKEDYDMRKNGEHLLMSVLDQLLKVNEPELMREILLKSPTHLANDLIARSLMSERLARGPLEQVLENACQTKLKLRLMEINLDDGLLFGQVSSSLQRIEPQLALDYLLAHPNVDRLKANKLLIEGGENQPKTHKLKDLASLFSDRQLRDLDFIIYKDKLDGDDEESIVSSLEKALGSGGFLMIAARRELTFAERLVAWLAKSAANEEEKEAVGLRLGQKLGQMSAELNETNARLAARCDAFARAAKKVDLLQVSRKSDASSGASLLLLRKRIKSAELPPEGTPGTGEPQVQASTCGSPVLVQVRHHDTTAIAEWLERLKAQFKATEEKEETAKSQAELELEQRAGDAPSAAPSSPEAEEAKATEPRGVVWLCAVSTRSEPVSGVVGLVQALRKELGSKRLRCFFDCHTFAHRCDQVSLEEISGSARFKEALERDLLWNCVDARGRLGSFRHFTVNDFFTYDECLCSNQEEEESSGTGTGTGVVAQVDQRGQVNQVQVNQVDQVNTDECVYANVATRGDLSSFAWFQAPFKYLEAEQRQQLIKVAYAALNFRDVMLASGRLPLDAIPAQALRSDCLIGLEFSGVEPSGRRVMGMVTGRAIATHLLCGSPRDGQADANLSGAVKVQVPDWMELREAATIPVVYATAIYALVCRGKARAGESVLVHAGSGGVGQAAIRLAHHFGLQVFTTVGSSEKRAFLLEEFADCLSDEQIFSSRDCQFERRLLELTRGRGVDLVLNSLADDKLQASVRCLADGGRFLEIGKYDMSVDSKLELLALDTNKSFHGILLDKLFDTHDLNNWFKSQLKCVLDTLEDGLKKGYVRPIKHTTFKRHEIEQAFRFMATGKHTGKVLIEIDPSVGSKTSSERLSVVRSPRSIPRFQLSPLKSYIVTGGLGGFGLELTKWLVKQGARHLLLTSRAGLATGYQRITLGRLEASAGARFQVVDARLADATTREGARKLCRLALDLAPAKQLGGVFHLAMVLKDTLLDNMSADDFELVCRPKVATCVELDAATRALKLEVDFFVAFSSVTSGKGNAGQANYAYANSCLERLCERRRAAGLHGLAVQWGAIGDVGVAYEKLGGNDAVVGGTLPQRMPSCLSTLGKLLCSPFAVCLSVVPANKLLGAQTMRGDLVAAVFHVLGIKDASKVSEAATLGELGLDSLMAVEIRQHIERDYDVSLTHQQIRALTIAKIRQINDKERPAKAALKPADKQPANVQTPAKPQAKVDTPQATKETKKVDLRDAQLEIEGDLDALAQGGSKVDSADFDLERVVSRGNLAAFRPQLRLPEADFCPLNAAAAAEQAQVGVAEAGQPLFFIPPIYGDFKRLLSVCARLGRPCWGVNWTRRFGKKRRMAELVELHLELLEQFPAWPPGELGERRQVDLVGYSLGATIAFELMAHLHRLQRRAARRLADGLANHSARVQLEAGKLIMLDGSPKQIELGSWYLAKLRLRPMTLSAKADELLMLYVATHTERLEPKPDYLAFHRSLEARVDMEAKMRFASERLVRILAKHKNAPGEEPPGEQEEEDRWVADEGVALEVRAKQVADAMEAFCGRYELAHSFKSQSTLPAHCVLIRAKEALIKDEVNQGAVERHADDLGLGSIVEGHLELFCLEGKHDTFLEENQVEVAEIINKRTGAPGKPQVA